MKWEWLRLSTVRAIDLRYLEHWAKSRKRPVIRQPGVDEIYLGKRQKFLTVVSDLATGEPLWFGAERHAAVPDCKIVFDKFHVMQHANQAVDEVLRAVFFGKGGWKRGFIKGKRSMSCSVTTAA